MNVYNTRFVRTVNITNVYNTVYVNKTVYNRTLVNARAPNAVMAMPQSAFASGRPVRQAAVPVRQVDVAKLQSASVIGPNVAPTRQAVVPAAGRPVARPTPQVIQRPVIARSTPPASVPAHQAVVQKTAGQPPNQQPAGQVVRPVAANVRQVAAVTPVPVKTWPASRNISRIRAIARTCFPGINCCSTEPAPDCCASRTFRFGESAPAGRSGRPDAARQPSESWRSS